MPKSDKNKQEGDKGASGEGDLQGAAATPPASDLSAVLQYLLQQDQARKKEEDERRKEEAERRKEEAERRKEEGERFEQLLRQLAPRSSGDASGMPSGTQDGGGGTPRSPSSPNASIQPPKPLPSDATLQQFRAWRFKWADYADMVDLPSMPLYKQHIQLRAALSAEMLLVLEHTLEVPHDTQCSVDDVLARLHAHIRTSSNEALRRKAFSECKQAEGEPFHDFWLRLKILAQEVDLCKAQDQACSDHQKKHGILMGIRDEEMTQKLFEMDSSASLQDVLERCFQGQSLKPSCDVPIQEG